MFWIALCAVALLALAPFAFTAWRGGRLRSRQYAAIALHRAQLAELDRDLAQGRILQAEHAGAQLEIQRRLLADSALTESVGNPVGTPTLVLIGAAVPALALGLYLSVGQPHFPPPDAPAAQAGAAPEAVAKQAEAQAKDDALLAQLRARLAVMDPKAENTQAGYMLLGNAELRRGHMAQAVAAWKMFLAQRFDAQLAVETGEAITQLNGHVTPEAKSLFQQALKTAPPDAPWRELAIRRIIQAGK